MTNKEIFQGLLIDFSHRFKDHNYDEFTINLFYERLNYLTIDQLNNVLNYYLMEVDHKYFLPCPKVLLEVVYNRSPRRQIDVLKGCEFCYDKGFILAKSVKEKDKYMKFKCDCKKGDLIKDLPPWKESYKKLFIAEFDFYKEKSKEKISDVINILIEKMSGKAIKGDLPDNLKTIGESISDYMKDLEEKYEKKSSVK